VGGGGGGGRILLSDIHSIDTFLYCFEACTLLSRTLTRDIEY
jgi:hypothetical protein